MLLEELNRIEGGSSAANLGGGYVLEDYADEDEDEVNDEDEGCQDDEAYDEEGDMEIMV